MTDIVDISAVVPVQGDTITLIDSGFALPEFPAFHDNRVFPSSRILPVGSTLQVVNYNI